MEHLIALLIGLALFGAIGILIWILAKFEIENYLFGFAFGAAVLAWAYLLGLTVLRQ